MKKQHQHSKNSLMSMFIIIALFSMAACGSIQEQSNASGTTDEQEVQITPPETGIHTAAFMGDVKTIQQHIKAGTDLNAKDDYGSTPLIIAITFGKTDASRILIAGGADITITNNDNATPLHIAAFLCRTEIVNLLLEKGADKNATNKYGDTPLASVESPFGMVKGIYEQFNKDLGPLGLKLDLAYLEKTRPVVADLLR